MSKFKIGDKVRVVCNAWSTFIGVKTGDIGVIISIDDDELPINIRIDERDVYGFKESELELITDEMSSNLKTKNNTYQICERPIAIRTKEMWIKERKLEILDAIIKLTKAEMVVPIEWVEELKELEEGRL